MGVCSILSSSVPSSHFVFKAPIDSSWEFWLCWSYSDLFKDWTSYSYFRWNLPLRKCLFIFFPQACARGLLFLCSSYDQRHAIAIVVWDALHRVHLLDDCFYFDVTHFYSLRLTFCCQGWMPNLHWPDLNCSISMESRWATISQATGTTFRIFRPNQMMFTLYHILKQVSPHSRTRFYLNDWLLFNWIGDNISPRSLVPPLGNTWTSYILDLLYFGPSTTLMSSKVPNLEINIVHPTQCKICSLILVLNVDFCSLFALLLLMLQSVHRGKT